MSDDLELSPINDTLNPEPPWSGMPWYVILGILTLSVAIYMLPFRGCKIFGILLCPFAMGVGYWLVKDDPKEFSLIVHSFMQATDWDAGK